MLLSSRFSSTAITPFKFILSYIPDNPSPLFGKKLHEQVEDRLKFYDTGDAPKKNIDVMKEAIEELNKSIAEGGRQEVDKKKKKKKKKDKKAEVEEEEKPEIKQEVKSEPEVEENSQKKKKKKKKAKVEG